jgi:hypothetical protein
MALWFERALFVVAPPDSGKSTQLRSMFLDRRLSRDGQVPSSAEYPRLPDVCYLSNERRLYLRLTSPHEAGETLEEFTGKINSKTVTGRWCCAGPFQPDACKQMPNVVDSVQHFIKAFEPERVRVVFLSPTRHRVILDSFLPGRDLSQELLQIPRVEVACIDARQRLSNGLFLADFFDFS